MLVVEISFEFFFQLEADFFNNSILLQVKPLMIVCLLVIVYDFSVSENVLVGQSFYGGSHILALRKISEALAARGHEVNYFSISPPEEIIISPLKNKRGF